VRDATWQRDGRGYVGVAAVALGLLLALAIGWTTNDWMDRKMAAGSEAPYLPASFERWLPPRAERPAIVSSEVPDASEGPEAETPRAALVGAGESDAFPGVDLERLVMDRATAMKVLLRRWGVALEDLGAGDPCRRVTDFGLVCEPGDGGWRGLLLHDRPALIRLEMEDGERAFAAVGALDEDRITLDLLEGSEPVPIAAVDGHWGGEFLLLWQPPPVGNGVIGPSATGEAVQWLRKLISQVPDLSLEATSSGVYDAALRDAVRRFQEREGLEVDGIAGPKTLIRLHNAVDMPEIPRL
jgi:general secretion pathway protein A